MGGTKPDSAFEAQRLTTSSMAPDRGQDSRAGLKYVRYSGIRTALGLTMMAKRAQVYNAPAEAEHIQKVSMAKQRRRFGLLATC